MASRTQLEFTFDGDLCSVLELWSKKHGYRLKSSNPPMSLYQKGVGFWVAPMMLSVEQNGTRVKIEAWVRMNLFTRATTFFILPKEMGIESGGFCAVFPRNMARKAVNNLLLQLNQAIIP